MKLNKYQGGGSTPQGDPDTIQKIIDAAKSSGSELLKTLLQANMLPLKVVDPLISYIMRSEGEGEEAGESEMRGTDAVRDMIESRELPEQAPIAYRVTPRPEDLEYVESRPVQEIPINLPRVIKQRPADRRQKAEEELMRMLGRRGY